MTRYAMRQGCVPRKFTSCTKLPGAQRFPELALRSMDFCAPENLIFLVLSKSLSIANLTPVILKTF